MINSIVANISAGSNADIFNDKEVNVAIKSIWIYNKSDSNETTVTFMFKEPQDNIFLELLVKPKETVFIDSDLYVPIQNYMNVSTDVSDVNIVFSFIEDSRVNTIV